MVLLITIAVCAVVGVLVSQPNIQTTGEASTDLCSYRNEMNARTECKCFEELATPLQGEQYINWQRTKARLTNTTSMPFDFHVTDCVLENLALVTLVEMMTGDGSEVLTVTSRDPIIEIAARFAVISFYVALNGDDWDRNDGWLDIGIRPCSWFGIECTMSGRPSGLLLNRNNLHGNLTATASLSMLSMLGAIDLGDNPGITGTLPSEIFTLHSLKSIDLRSNGIQGSIPNLCQTEVLDAINVINLSNNSLTGRLPTELGCLYRLRSLRLELNRLTGPIPSEISNMSSLEVFTVHDNKLTGTLPPIVDGLEYLKIFGVHNNNLVGEIHAISGNLGRISFMDLSFNQFSGSMPKAFDNCSDSNYIDMILVDCDDFYNQTACSNDSVCCFCSETFQRYDDFGSWMV